MTVRSATATASPNIAFIKYWGNRDDILRIPSNGSISMTLSGLETKTRVTLNPDLDSDSLSINGKIATTDSLHRASSFLNVMRRRFGRNEHCEVESTNNFPSGTGIASSASAYAALAGAYVRAVDADTSMKDLSMLARQGSGSASRSIFGGFVEWKTGESSEDSYAEEIASPTHWNIVDLIAVIGYAHKKVGSASGHLSANSSPVQNARVLSAPARLLQCRQAILQRDFPALTQVSELDSNLLHSVMMTSSPPLLYWQPPTISVMQAVQEWRTEGVPVFYTIDAGPNVHCLTTDAAAQDVLTRLSAIPGVLDILTARPGEGIRWS